MARPRVRSDADTVQLAIDVPGVTADQVSVSAVADRSATVLDVVATREVLGRTERFAWSTRLAGVDPASVSAHLDHGVLVVTASRVAPSVHQVQVQVGAAPALAAAGAAPDEDDASVDADPS
jgi:HSP20 family molecular chaperone IbpA